MIDKNFISYRRDSDIPREFGDFQTELKMARFKRKQEEWSERMSPDEHLKDIMNQKSPLGEPFVTWLVSNCDHTGGADMRFRFALHFFNNFIFNNLYFNNLQGVAVTPQFRGFITPDQGL